MATTRWLETSFRSNGRCGVFLSGAVYRYEMVSCSSTSKCVRTPLDLSVRANSRQLNERKTSGGPVVLLGIKCTALVIAL